MTQSTADPEAPDPWAQPPDWVPLPDLPRWLERHLELPGSADAIIPKIIEAIRGFRLTYEIQGLPLSDAGSPPSGFAWSGGHSAEPQHIIVTDWDAAEPDWRAGTVAGPDRPGEAGNRYAIRVLWLRAMRWTHTELFIPAMRREARRTLEPSTSAPGASDALSSGARGGRPPKWDWAKFDREMMRLANTPDGLPPRTELTKHMLQWCIGMWDDHPSESMVRDRIAQRYPGG